MIILLKTLYIILTTFRALVQAQKVMFGAGSRPDATKLLVLIVDKKWVSSAADVYGAARNLIDKGAKVIAVLFSNEIKVMFSCA